MKTVGLVILPAPTFAKTEHLCGMIEHGWFIFALAVLVLAYLSATYHSQQGYPFWRTFILAVMGFAGLGLFIFKLIIGA